MEEERTIQQEEEFTLEELFAQLDGILEKMESAQLSLDDTFGLYESGLKKLKLCSEKLDLIEKKMLVLSGGQDPEDSVR